MKMSMQSIITWTTATSSELLLWFIQRYSTAVCGNAGGYLNFAYTNCYARDFLHLYLFLLS